MHSAGYSAGLNALLNALLNAPAECTLIKLHCQAGYMRKVPEKRKKTLYWPAGHHRFIIAFVWKIKPPGLQLDWFSFEVAYMDYNQIVFFTRSCFYSGDFFECVKMT